MAGPGIVSIEQQTRLIGETAAEQMMNVIQGNKTEVKKYIIPAKLQWRYSV